MRQDLNLAFTKNYFGSAGAPRITISSLVDSTMASSSSVSWRDLVLREHLFEEKEHAISLAFRDVEVSVRLFHPPSDILALWAGSFIPFHFLPPKYKKTVKGNKQRAALSVPPFVY